MSELSQVIATRMFELADGGSVTVELHAPEPDDASPNGDFRCAYRISGLEDREDKPKYGYGVDPLQALILTLERIGIDLYSSDEARAGHLTWLGGSDLGLAVRDLLSRSDQRPPD